MVLNEIGRVAENEWFKLADRFRHIQLSPFCIMPNHIHGIIQITSPSTSSSSSSSLEESNQEKEGKRDKVSLGSIIGKYKSLVMKECLNQNKEKYPKDQLYRYLEKSGNEIIMSTLSELGNYMIKLRDI
ncbi:MAG: hypothetical protein NTV01_22500 [Bacteroidia bacterium]|nr:hypothetical protein [Bacteroidia bacterium]